MTDARVVSIYLDTTVFIDAVEGLADVAAAPRRLITFLREKPGFATTSELTFAETLAPPQRMGALPLHVKRRVYLDLLLLSGFVTLVPVTRDILIETADLRSVSRMKLPDAIHMVSAVRAACRYLVSRDRDFQKLPADMTLVKSDADGIEQLLRIVA
jgi:predicted nucleic acid-binding protein